MLTSELEIQIFLINPIRLPDRKKMFGHHLNFSDQFACPNKFLGLKMVKYLKIKEAVIFFHNFCENSPKLSDITCTSVSPRTPKLWIILTSSTRKSQYTVSGDLVASTIKPCLGVHYRSPTFSCTTLVNVLDRYQVSPPLSPTRSCIHFNE